MVISKLFAAHYQWLLPPLGAAAALLCIWVPAWLVALLFLFSGIALVSFGEKERQRIEFVLSELEYVVAKEASREEVMELWDQGCEIYEEQDGDEDDF